jgi:hypothetical protein
MINASIYLKYLKTNELNPNLLKVKLQDLCILLIEMPGLGWRKNIKGRPKDNFWKVSLNMKGLPLIYKNEVPIL